MNLIKRYRIEHDSDLIYAKRDLSNFLKKDKSKERFSLALMELGTNLLKHAGEGEIWLLQNEHWLLAALDRGPGIEDIEWAKQRGTSSYPGSLGVGLSQLDSDEEYRLEIFSKVGLGTVVLFHKERAKELFFSIPLVDNFNGDFFIKKGRYYLFGDAAGHGIKASKSAKFIQEFFLSHSFSCLFVDDFFKTLDSAIKKENLRGAVLSIVEVTKKYIYICGVGDIEFFANKERHSFKEGIVGVAFSRSEQYRFERPVNFCMKSDGIDTDFELYEDIADPFLCALVAVFYSTINDDRSIFIIKDI